MDKPLRVLLVEDSSDDAELILRELRYAGYDPIYERVETATDMKTALEREEWDIILSDHSMPRFSSTGALEQLHFSGLDLPFIIVSAIIGEDIAVAAMKAGAHDYIMKDKLARLVPAIERELKEAEERQRRRQAEEALRKSESSLANAQRIAHLGNWEWDLEKNIVHWSDEVYRIFGLAPRAFPVTYEIFLSFVHHDDREYIKKSIHEALYEKKQYTIDHRIVRPDGSERIVHEEAEVIFNNTGRAIQMNGITQDITDRKKTEEQLRKLSCAIEQSPSIVIITDICGNIEYVNPKFTQLTGYPLEEVIGKKPHILKSDKTSPEEYKQLWDTITAGGEWRGEIVNRKKNGELYWEFALISPIRDPQGNVTHFLKIAENITRIKLAEEEKTKLREQLYHAQKLESIGKLSGAIAHDFNNILSAIIGYTEVLQKKMKDENVLKDCAERILTAAEKATHLTQGLLTFSRKRVNNPKPVNLNTILRWSESILSILIQKDIKFNVMLTKKDCTVMVDGSQMEQVFMNLVINARDAMPNGGTLTISTDVVQSDTLCIKTYGYDRIGEYILISVTDTGIGMDEETKKRVFEPFFTTKDPGKGTGLGLAIVYGIVKQHQGYIHVDSAPGKGTTFKIYLPIIKLAVEEKALKELPIPRDGTEILLIAEDEEAIRKNLKT